jgi:acyl-CoA synthetase (AMP-forming)/AMP-acid ligase II
MTAEGVMFGGLPLLDAFGHTVGLNAAIAARTTLILVLRFSPAKALEVLQRDKVIVMLGVPIMYTAVLQHPDLEAYDTSLQSPSTLAHRPARMRCARTSRNASLRRRTPRVVWITDESPLCATGKGGQA